MPAKRSVRVSELEETSVRAEFFRDARGGAQPSCCDPTPKPNRRAWWRFWSAFALVAAAVESLGGADADANRNLAYLDPGAGSFVIQALVAMLAGIAVTVKVYWQRIRGFLGLANPDEDDDEASDRPEE